MAMALANARWVPRGLYDRAVKALGHIGVTDVITLMGHYTQRRDDLGILRRASRGYRHGALSEATPGTVSYSDTRMPALRACR